MESIASKLIDKMVRNQVINFDEKEFYEYVFITRSEQLMTFLVMLTLAAINKVFLPTILFLCFFFGIRKRSGGYHAGNFKKCFLGTTGIYILFLFVVLPAILFNMKVILFILVASSIILLIIGAVNHPNIGWDGITFKTGKQLARETVVLETFVIVVLAVLGGDNVYIAFMSFGIILNAILVLLAKLLKQEVS